MNDAENILYLRFGTHMLEKHALRLEGAVVMNVSSHFQSIILVSGRGSCSRGEHSCPTAQFPGRAMHVPVGFQCVESLSFYVF